MDIVIKNGNIYIKVNDNNLRTEIVDEHSSVEFIDGTYKEISKDDYKDKGYDMSVLEAKKPPRNASIINLWSMIIKGFKQVSNYPVMKKMCIRDSPYAVNVNGKLYWMMDAYTTSDMYPYSEPFVGDEVKGNYIRNSIKVVVDAYNGDTKFYVVDKKDPLAKTVSYTHLDVYKRQRNGRPQEISCFPRP